MTDAHKCTDSVYQVSNAHFTQATSNTRGNSKIFKTVDNLKSRSSFFTETVVADGNSLPEAVVRVPSVICLDGTFPTIARFQDSDFSLRKQFKIVFRCILMWFCTFQDSNFNPVPPMFKSYLHSHWKNLPMFECSLWLPFPCMWQCDLCWYKILLNADRQMDLKTSPVKGVQLHVLGNAFFFSHISFRHEVWVQVVKYASRQCCFYL